MYKYQKVNSSDSINSIIEVHEACSEILQAANVFGKSKVEVF